MKSEFCIIIVDASIANRQVIIETNFRIDDTSLTKENVKFINANTGLLEAYELKADGKKVIVQLFQEPQLNKKYILQVSGIKDMLSRTLNSPLSKDMYFHSAVKTKPKIISPVQGFAFRTNIVEIEIDVISEENESLDYCYEISSDVTFFNIVKTITSHERNITTTLDNDGQYYFRARAVSKESKDDFSEWTEVSTFIVVSTEDSTRNDNNKFLEDIVEDMDFFYDEETSPKILDKTLDGTLVRGWYSVMLSSNIDFDFIDEDITEEGVVKIGEIVGYKEDL